MDWRTGSARQSLGTWRDIRAWDALDWSRAVLFRLVLPRKPVGITLLDGDTATENSGPMASGCSPALPSGHVNRTMTGTSMAPASLWYWYSMRTWNGGGGKGSVWYCGSSIVFSASRCGSCRCQYGRV